MQVNSAAITGELLPVARDAGPSEEHEITSSANVLLAGTALVVGNGRAVVFATGMRTALGEIAHLTQTAGSTLSPLQREVAFLTRVIAALATALGVAFFAIGYALGLPLWHNGMFAIGDHRGQRARGAAPDRNPGACHGESQALGAEERPDQASRLGRGAGLDHRDLHRQDRHVDREPHDGAPTLRGRTVLRFAPRSARPGGRLRAGPAAHCRALRGGSRRRARAA